MMKPGEIYKADFGPDSNALRKFVKAIRYACIENEYNLNSCGSTGVYRRSRALSTVFEAVTDGNLVIRIIGRD